jgi:hypothetical protein
MAIILFFQQGLNEPQKYGKEVVLKKNILNTSINNLNAPFVPSARARREIVAHRNQASSGNCGKMMCKS